MSEAAVAPSTATATTPQAAPLTDSPHTDAGVLSPSAATEGEAASGAEAKDGEKAQPAPETPEQRQKRVEAAGKRARREAAQARERDAAMARERQARIEAEQRGARGLELEQIAQRDKWEAARRLGIDPRELAQAALREGTPEYQAEQERRAMREELDALKREAAERAQRDQQQAMQQRGQSIQSAFLKASGDASMYPDVAKLPERARMAWARDLIAEAKQEADSRGLDWSRVAPTDARLLAYMQKSLSGVPAVPAKVPDTESAPDGKQNGSASPRTVTSKVAAQKFAAPANWDDLSDEQQKRWIAQELERVTPTRK